MPDSFQPTGNISDALMHQNSQNKLILPFIGSVTFPDDEGKLFKFWFHPKEATIYWDADKGSTENIWRGSIGEKHLYLFVSFIYQLFCVHQGRFQKCISF